MNQDFFQGKILAKQILLYGKIPYGTFPSFRIRTKFIIEILFPDSKGETRLEFNSKLAKIVDEMLASNIPRTYINDCIKKVGFAS